MQVVEFYKLSTVVINFKNKKINYAIDLKSQVAHTGRPVFGLVWAEFHF